MRKLGIPTAVDRVIQHAILQVLSPEWDATFSENSFGFRPGRSAHQTAGSRKRYWHISRSPALNMSHSRAYLTELGLPMLLEPDTNV